MQHPIWVRSRHGVGTLLLLLQLPAGLVGGQPQHLHDLHRSNDFDENRPASPYALAEVPGSIEEGQHAVQRLDVGGGGIVPIPETRKPVLSQVR